MRSTYASSAASPSNVGMSEEQLDRDFEKLGLNRQEIQKYDQPLVDCLDKYFRQLNSNRDGGQPQPRRSFKSKADVLQNDKYYLAKSQMIVTGSILKLDETDPE